MTEAVVVFWLGFQLGQWVERGANWLLARLSWRQTADEPAIA